MLKRFLLNVFLPLALLAFAPEHAAAQGDRSAMVEVVFTPEMQRADLDRITAEMKQQGIDLDVTRARYADGRLRTIAFSVRTPGGSGTASGELRPDRPLGFRYDPRPGAEAVFTVGALR